MAEFRAFESFAAFDLLLSRSKGRRRYRAQVLRSPVGEANGKLRWPPRAALQPLLEQLDHPAAEGFRAPPAATRLNAGAVRDVVTSLDRIGALKQDKVAEPLGALLFDFLFQGEIRECWRKSLDKARRDGFGLALRLHLSAAPELASLPWEYLYDPQFFRFLVQDHVHVARTLGRDPGLSQPLGATLRILAIVSNPYGDLNAQGERQALKEIEQASHGRIEVEILTPPTLARLRNTLRDREFDLIHFGGHGDFKEGGGALVFEGEQGGAHPVPATTLASILQDYPGLQLVVLNACKGGQQAPSGLFPGVAQALILHGVRTVVAMQAPIFDNAAIAFCRDFFEGLAETRSVEPAMARGREAVLVEVIGTDWAAPCLFTREGAIVQQPQPWTRMVSLAAVPTALCTLFHFWPQPCRTLTISYPADHAEVGQLENITGTSCLLPPGQDPWIVVYSAADQLYYPHKFKADLAADGRWWSTDTEVGSKADGGKAFEVIAVLADEEGGRRLAAASSGVPDFPAGKIYQRINVTRQK
jgi:CHAT domain